MAPVLPGLVEVGEELVRRQVDVRQSPHGGTEADGVLPGGAADQRTGTRRSRRGLRPGGVLPASDRDTSRAALARRSSRSGYPEGKVHDRLHHFAGRAPEAPHGGGRVDAMAADVADDEANPCAGQRPAVGLALE